MKISALLVLSCLFLFSCSKSTKDQNVQIVDSSKATKITLIDSIRIDYLGTLALLDVSEDHKKIMLYDRATSKIVLSDMQGSILNELELEGDSPNSYGRMLGPGRFTSEGNIFIIGMRGFFTYSLDGEVLSSKKLPENYRTFMTSTNQSTTPLSHNGKFINTYFDFKGKEKNQAEYYQQLTLMTEFDTVENTHTPFLNIPAESKLRDGLGYEISDFQPSYTIHNNKLLVTLGAEAKLYEFDLTTRELLLSRELNYQSFYPTKGEELSKKQPGSIVFSTGEGLTRNIISTDKNILLFYYPGFNQMDKDRVEELKSKKDNDGLSALYKELDKKYLNRIHILDKEGNFLSDVENEHDFNIFSGLAKGQDIWIMKNINMEEEEDYFTIYKARVN